MTDFNKTLDARGLDCPLPLLRMKKELAGMEPGEVLYVMATDRGSVRDFEAFAKQTGNVLLDFREEDACFHYWVQKS